MNAGDKRGHLKYTVGLPRSGKSTWADKWAAEKPNRVVVAADDFRLALHGTPWLAAAEPLIHATVKLAVRALLIRGFDVVVDETNLTPGQKASWSEIDPEAEFVLFDATPEVCKQRAIDTGQDYLVPVIDRMSKLL